MRAMKADARSLEALPPGKLQLDEGLGIVRSHSGLLALTSLWEFRVQGLGVGPTVVL